MKIPLIILMILIILPFVYAETEYPNFGGTGEDYYSDDYSRFNGAMTRDSILDQIASNDPQMMPLVNDLDGDGTKEIIFLGDGVLYVSHGTIDVNGALSLEVVGSYTTNATTDGPYFSNMITYDIDGDSSEEIIFASIQDERIYVIGWNSTHLEKEGIKGYSGTNYIDPTPIESADGMIGCGDPDGCVIVANDRNKNSAGTRTLYVNVFNATHIMNTNLISSSGAGNPYCFPEQKGVPYDSVTGKYFFTYGLFNGNIYLSTLVVNNTHNLTQTVLANTGQYMPNIDCKRGVPFFTSPIVMDFYNAVGNEVLYAHQTAIDSFKIRGHEVTTTTTYKSSYPVIQTATGRLISSIFTSSAFTDSVQSSACVVGFDATEGAYGTIDILCADVKASDVYYTDNQEFFYPFTSELDYNLTSYFYDSTTSIYPILGHSIESSEGNSRSEILTSYGVFELSDDDIQCQGLPPIALGYCEADLIYDTSLDSQASLISVDYFDSGYEDIIGLSTTNLFYLDDGFINRNAYLGYCTQIRPSLDADWALNYTNHSNKVWVDVKPIDPDDDLVSARVYLYYGEYNQQDSGWSINYSSETSIPFRDFYPNQTTSGSILRICVRDSENYYNIPVCEEKNFIVKVDGDLYTDSSECIGQTEEEYESVNCSDDDGCPTGYVCGTDGICAVLPTVCSFDGDCPKGYSCISRECELLPTPEDNNITSAVNVFAKFSGVPVIVLVFVIFVFVSYEIFTTDYLPPQAKLPATGLMLFGLIVLFTILGLINIVWLVILIIVSLGGLGVGVASYMKGRG